MENNNQMVEAFNKVIADSGIQIELWREYATEKWKAQIDTSEHDKQIRAKVIDECVKAINDLNIEYAYPHTICNILEQLKEQKK